MWSVCSLISDLESRWEFKSRQQLFLYIIETAKHGSRCLAVLQWPKTVGWIYHNINSIKLACIINKLGSCCLLYGQ